MAAAAHLSVPLWFTPVPLTLSDLAVLMVGLALGPSTAFAALLLYLAEGASGLPVFSPAGPGGMAQLLGPTGGFLLSYPFAATLTSWLSRTLHTRLTARFGGNLLAALAGSTLLMICGVVWLGVWAPPDASRRHEQRRIAVPAGTGHQGSGCSRYLHKPAQLASELACTAL